MLRFSASGVSHDAGGKRAVAAPQGNRTIKRCMNEPLQPIGSVSDLCQRAMRERRFGALMMMTARRLGADPENLREARAWLVMFAADDDGEQRVLDAANACPSEV